MVKFKWFSANKSIFEREKFGKICRDKILHFYTKHAFFTSIDLEVYRHYKKKTKV